MILKSEEYIRNSHGSIFADPMQPESAVNAIMPTQVVPLTGYAELIDAKMKIPLQPPDEAISGILRIFQELVFLGQEQRRPVRKAVDVMRVVRVLTALRPRMQPIDAFARAVELVESNKELKLDTHDELSEQWLKHGSFFAGEAFLNSVVLALFRGADEKMTMSSARLLLKVGHEYIDKIEMALASRPGNITLRSMAGGRGSNFNRMSMPPIQAPIAGEEDSPLAGGSILAPIPEEPTPPPSGDAGNHPPPPPPPPGAAGIPPPPPPPPGGPGVPPPPPPGGAGAKKPNVKPAEKVRNLYWAKLPDAKAMQLVWKDIDDSRFKADGALIASLFPLVEAKKVEGKKAAVPVGPISVLESNREKSISILLQRLRMPPAEVADSIRKMDGRLSEDTIAALAKMFPTNDEAKLISDLESTDGLPPADAFFAELLKVNGYKERADIMILRATASTSIADLQKQLNIYLDGVESIMNSSNLRICLEIALRIGNVLNGGTRRGGAYGFKLSSLMKIVETRSSDPSYTAMDFLVQTVEANYPASMDIVDELKNLPSAAKVEVDGLKGIFMPLKISMTKIAETVQKGNLGDEYNQAGEKLLKEVNPLIDNVTEMFKKIENENMELMALFLEADPRKPSDIISDITAFVAAFDSTYKNIIKRRALEARKRRDEQRTKMKSSQRLSRGIAEEMIDRIKAGSILQK